jgi:hypothetical protein
MISRLLPRPIDNTFHGHRLALWLFALLLFMRVAMSVNSILNASDVASSADGIPLHTYTPAAAQTIASLFALLGLSHLMICVVGVLVLVRYRSMVPFMFALLLLEHLSRRLILQFSPIIRTGTPPGFYVNLVLLAVMLLGLALSLRSQGNLEVHGGERRP